MHLQGIRDQERQQAIQRQKNRPFMPNQSFNSVPPPDQAHLLHSSQPDSIIPFMSLAGSQRLDQFDSAQEAGKLFKTPSSQFDNSVRNGPHTRADSLASTGQQAIASAVADESRTFLWGPEGADYLQTDKMFYKWGLRALPPNLKTGYQPPHSDAPVTPCWYLMKKMQDRGLFYGHNVDLCGVPNIVTQQIPMIVDNKPNVEADPLSRISNGTRLRDFSQPPPLFDPSRPPPLMSSQGLISLNFLYLWC